MTAQAATRRLYANPGSRRKPIYPYIKCNGWLPDAAEKAAAEDEDVEIYENESNFGR